MALVYPHYTEVVSLQDKSYWSKSSAIWKMSQKRLVMLVLMPTTLRGMVSRIHEAVCRMAEGMRLIDGQALSLNRSRRLCIAPGMLAGIQTHTTHARTCMHACINTHSRTRARTHTQYIRRYWFVRATIFFLVAR